MKREASRRDAHWVAARGGFYDGFATGGGWCVPKVERNRSGADGQPLSKGCSLPARSSGKTKSGSHQATRTEPVVQILTPKRTPGCGQAIITRVQAWHPREGSKGKISRVFWCGLLARARARS